MKIYQINEPPHQQSFLAIFTAAPHRVMFFFGAVQLVLPVVVWCIELIGRYAGLWPPLDTLIPSTLAHAFVMLFGVFIFFMYGFLMTTYPRWMNGPTVKKEIYVSTCIWLNIGLLLFEAGIFYSLTLAVIGLGLFLFGWAMGQWGLFRVYRAAQAADKNVETLLNLALLCGWISAASFLIWLTTDNWSYVNFSIKGGLWLFLIPVLFVVTHRMLPFFGSTVIKDYRVVRPSWSIPLLLVCVTAHLLLELNYQLKWLFVADIPLAIVGWHHTLSWGFVKSFQDKLLAMLHIAFAWFAVGTSLLGLQSLYLLINDELILGKGPLHALTIGFITSMLIAMASRVSLGHSGRMLVADKITWAIFLGIQVTALLRILAEFNPINSLSGLSFNVIAALSWILLLGVWVLRYGVIYLRARVDGRPG